MFIAGASGISLLSLAEKPIILIVINLVLLPMFHANTCNERSILDDIDMEPFREVLANKVISELVEGIPEKGRGVRVVQEPFKVTDNMMVSEFQREYKVENTVLTIYQNPTLGLKDYATSGNKSVLTGCVLWDSGIAFWTYLGTTCENFSWLRGKRILELGSGTGYGGLVAASLGGDVTVTDVPQLMPLLQKNIDANAEQLKGTGGKICAQVLRWGNEEDLKLIPKPDIIIMSGAIYYEKSGEPLVSTLAALSDEDTELIICNENWSKHPLNAVFWNDFFSRAAKHFEFYPGLFEGFRLAPRESGGYGCDDGHLLIRRRLKSHAKR